MTTTKRIELVSDLGEVFKFDLNLKGIKSLIETGNLYLQLDYNKDARITYHNNNKKLLLIENLKNNELLEYNIVKYSLIVTEEI